MRELACRRQEAALGILGIKPGLDGVAVDPQVALGEGQGFACRHTQLQFHEIKAGDRLGNRVFDLQARVHLHEPEPVLAQRAGAVGDEFHRARAPVADAAGGLDRRLGHRGTDGFGHAGGGGFLDDLLVAALQRAVAFIKMDRGAVRVGEDLHLDMAGRGDVFLDQTGGVAEAGLCLTGGAFEGGGKGGRVLDKPHPLAAAARAGLDQDRVADGLRLARQAFGVLVLAVVAGHDGDACAFHQPLGRVLQAHGADGAGGGADEDKASRFDSFDETGVFREKAVAGVDGFGPGAQRGSDDGCAVQVAFRDGGGADADGFVGQRDVERLRIGVGVDGDGSDAHPAGGGDDAGGDFTPVGDQDLLEHGLTS